MRLIDADALSEALLNRWSIADERKEELIRAVLADIVTPIVVSQPTIEPEQRWIPVSEKLPEHDFDDVLVCLHDIRKGLEQSYFFTEAYLVRGHWEFTLSPDMTYLEVVAWMQLPKPWKGNVD